ncbi:MAG TPA: SGNH/GDSL hydrolase family protein [Kofleriaceae bacterium]|nr:SGNH/GDSL hydrolase family protein [Kofleriaceae bacterium]
MIGKIAIASALVALAVTGVATADSNGRDDARWTATWASGPAGQTPDATPTFVNQTLREIIHTSVGGTQVRIKLSNAFGSDPIVIGSAHVARRRAGAQIVAATDRRLTFGGVDHVTIPVGALVVSDPVELDVPALSDLAVSFYLPQPATAATMHATALQTSYIAAGTGDATAAVDLPGAATTTSWHFLTGVDVRVRGGATVVALGDSITDGANSSTDANLRWPNVLASRLQARRGLRQLGVIDQGIIGNRILHPTEPQFDNLFGPAGLARFDRDVLAQAGVAYVIVLLGINDIAHPGSSAPDSEIVSPEEIEAGLMQFVARAHEHGIKVFGATLTPFENATLVGFFSPDKEVKRQAVNRWIRTAGQFDAVIDFDAALRDPTHPARILPAFDGGDHLHPSDAGQQAMGQAIPLGLFDDPHGPDE